MAAIQPRINTAHRPCTAVRTGWVKLRPTTSNRHRLAPLTLTLVFAPPRGGRRAHGSLTAAHACIHPVFTLPAH